jgi:hypothetical protein
MNPFALDVEQLQSVKRFRSTLAANGVVYRDFTDTSAFVQQTREHLYSLIIDEWSDGHWIPIDGLPAPEAPTGGGAPDVPVHDSEPSHRVDGEMASAKGETIEQPGEEPELGYLEYMERFHQEVPAVIETFEQMSRHTKQVNERITARTAEMQSLTQEHERLKGVGGSREQQEQLGRSKKMVNAAADDLDAFAESMGLALGQYRTHSRAMFGSFRLAVQTGRELWTDETKGENRNAIETLIPAMETTLQQVAEFQATIRKIPALTGRFKQARNRTAAVLGELIAEITFSVDEAKRTVADLGAADRHQEGSEGSQPELGPTPR